MRRTSRKSRAGWTWVVLGIGVLLVVVGVGSFVLLRAFLGSVAFHEMVEDGLGEALGGQASLADLEWSGSEVFSESLVVAGDAGSPLREMSASRLRADLDWRSALTGRWKINNIEAISANLLLGGKTAVPPPSSREAPPAATPAGTPQWEIGEVRIPDLNVSWSPDTAPESPASASLVSVKVEGVQTVIKGTPPSLELEGKKGMLRLNGVPEMDLHQFSGRLVQNDLYLTRVDLARGESGRLSFSGVIGNDSELRGEWAGMDATEWIPGPWKGRLRGVFGGEVRVAWGASPGMEASGRFTVRDGVLQGIPILGELEKFTGSPQFRRMPLSELSASFEHQSGDWQFDDVVLESKGLLRAEGEILITASGVVEGSFRVGVSPQVLQWLPGSRERVFTENAAGYVWTDVRVAGTLSNLQEDLSLRLAVAAGEEVIESGLEAVPEVLENGPRGVLDLLVPFLQQ